MTINVIAHNIRSTHNIGSILRTADGFGIDKVYCTGYSPYPTQSNDSRLPHLSSKITKQISKTALGAEHSVPCVFAADILKLIDSLRRDNYQIIALEQTANSIMLPSFRPASEKMALILGEEVAGVSDELLKKCDIAVEIPMSGKKESFNVSVATGIALYAISLF